LHLAFELNWNQGKLAFTLGQGQPAWLRALAARGGRESQSIRITKERKNQSTKK
jgi:hypothetical protein